MTSSRDVIYEVCLKGMYLGPGPTMSGHVEGVQNSEMVP